MKIGDAAATTRTFTAADVARFARLGGAPLAGDAVPEPLIQALWSQLLGIRLPGLGTMYLKQETTFHRTARLGTALTARVTITQLRPDKHLVDLDTTCHDAAGTLVASGRALVYVRDVVGPRA